MRQTLLEWFQQRRFRRYGRKDGNAGIPALAEDQHYPPNLWQIKQLAERRLGELQHEWVEQDRELKAEYCSLLNEVPAAKEACDAAKEEYERSSLERSVAVDDERSRPAEIDRDTSPTEPSSVHEPDVSMETPTFKPRRVHMNPIAYRIAITFILIGEFPLNAIAFRLFGEAEVLTWVMTASLAFVLILSAHGLGLFLSLDRRTVAERSWVYVLTVLPIAVIGAIGVIREQYLEASGATQEGLGALGPIAGTVAFALINVLIYVAAAMLSYLAHDPDARAKRESELSAQKRKKELEERRLAAERREEELQAKGAALEAQRKAEEERKRAEEEQRREAPKQALRAAQSRLLELQKRLEAARTDRQKALQATQARAEQIKNYHEVLFAGYCAANIRAREDRQPPHILRKHPEINSPLLALLDLDWDCHHDYSPIPTEIQLTTE